jgi:hypothetical protein
MKKNFLFVTFVILVINAHTQQRYAYLPEGKVLFQTSYQKLIIRYKNNLKTGKLKNFVTDSSLSQASGLKKWYVFDLKKTQHNIDSFSNILNTLRNDTDLLYANPFLLYSDGTLQGLTNQIIVRLKTTTNINSLSSLFKQLNVISNERDDYIDREYILTINSNGKKDALDIANTLYETGLFEYCEPDFVKLGMFKTNDPVYALQWGVQNTGQYSGTPGADINVAQAWNVSTGSGIRVAVLDEGVDLNQPDLQGNLLAGFDALGLGSNGGPSGDDAHGTACAGIIGAIANNNIGISGVAYSSKIIPVRIGSNETISTTAAVAGINWAASTTGGNADILSCSWGGGSTSSSLNTAIANAISKGRGGKGCIILFSSGNDNSSSINYPSNLPNVIAVGGTNMCDQRFVITPTTPPNTCNYDTRLGTVSLNAGSNYGTGLAVVAPGINIATTDISGAAGFSNHTFDQGWLMFNQDYVENFDGTSAACPFAAATMALILSVNPNLTYAQATAILESTASKVGGYNYSSNLANGTWNNEMGYGRINACAAVNKALSTLYISGDNLVCATSNNYTIPNLPTGTTVQWSATPSGIVTINSPNAAQTTLTATGSGSFTLNATITGACSGTTVLTKSIKAGTPSISNFSFLANGPSCISYNNQAMSFGISYNGYTGCNLKDYAGITDVDWQISCPNPYQTTYNAGIYTCSTPSYVNNAGISVAFSYPNQSYVITFRFRVKNDCGWSMWSPGYYQTIKNCYAPSGINVSPNPSSSSIDVSLNSSSINNSAIPSNSNPVSIMQIEITDKSGTLIKEYKYSTVSTKRTLDISLLKPDMYYIRVFDSRQWQSQAFIKQ